MFQLRRINSLFRWPRTKHYLTDEGVKLLSAIQDWRMNSLEVAHELLTQVEKLHKDAIRIIGVDAEHYRRQQASLKLPKARIVPV